MALAEVSPRFYLDTNASFCGSNDTQLFLYGLFSPGEGLKNGSTVNPDSKQACNAGVRGQEQHGNEAACEFNL